MISRLSFSISAKWKAQFLWIRFWMLSRFSTHYAPAVVMNLFVGSPVSSFCWRGSVLYNSNTTVVTGACSPIIFGEEIQKVRTVKFTIVQLFKNPEFLTNPQIINFYCSNMVYLEEWFQEITHIPLYLVCWAQLSLSFTQCLLIFLNLSAPTAVRVYRLGEPVRKEPRATKSKSLQSWVLLVITFLVYKKIQSKKKT